eukprot:m51a1_g328 hypothetical protein (1669) ;mRNA; r:459943-466155
MSRKEPRAARQYAVPSAAPSFRGPTGVGCGGGGGGLDMDAVIDSMSKDNAPRGLPSPPSYPSGSGADHVEQLEYTTYQLREINSRVQQLMKQYETAGAEASAIAAAVVASDGREGVPGKPLGSSSASNGEDPFQIYEEDTEDIDPQKVIESSKGKVQVLIVDYDKLLMTREGVLDSLQKWFSHVGDVAEDGDLRIAEMERTNAEPYRETVHEILQAATTAKERLGTIHHNVVGEAEERMNTMQKSIEKKNDDLKKLRFQIAQTEAAFDSDKEIQRYKEREGELKTQVDGMGKKLVKMQEQLEDQLHRANMQATAASISRQPSATMDTSKDAAQRFADVQEMEKKLDQISAKYDQDLRATFDQMMDRISQQKDKEMIELTIQTYEKRIETIRHEHESDKVELNQKFEQIRSADAADYAEQLSLERRAWQSKLESANRRAEENRRALEAVESQHQEQSWSSESDSRRLTALLDEAQQTRDKLEGNLQTANAEIQSLKAQLAAAVAEIAATREAAKQAQSQTAAQSTQQAPARKASPHEIGGLQRQIVALKKQLEAEKSVKKALIAEASNWKKRAMTRDEKIMDVAKLEEQMTELEDKLHRAREENNEGAIYDCEQELNKKRDELQAAVRATLPEIAADAEVDASLAEADAQGEDFADGSFNLTQNHKKALERIEMLESDQTGDESGVDEPSERQTSDDEIPGKPDAERQGEHESQPGPGAAEVPSDVERPASTPVASAASAQGEQDAKNSSASGADDGKHDSSAKSSRKGTRTVVQVLPPSESDIAAIRKELQKEYDLKAKEFTDEKDRLLCRIRVLEAKVSLLSTTNQKLVAGEKVPAVIPSDEQLTIEISEMESRERESHNFELRKNNRELTQRVQVLEAQLAGTRELAEAVEAKRQHVEGLLRTLEINYQNLMASQSKNSGASQGQTQIVEELRKAYEAERASLTKQVARTNEILSEERRRWGAATAQLGDTHAKAIDEAVKRAAGANESEVQTLKERVSKLTSALVERMADADLAEHVQKDAQCDSEAAKRQAERNIDRMRTEGRRTEDKLRNIAEQRVRLVEDGLRTLVVAAEQVSRQAAIAEAESMALAGRDGSAPAGPSPLTQLVPKFADLTTTLTDVRAREDNAVAKDINADGPVGTDEKLMTVLRDEQLVSITSALSALLQELSASFSASLKAAVENQLTAAIAGQTNLRERTIDLERMLGLVRQDLAQRAFDQAMSTNELESRVEEQGVYINELLQRTIEDLTYRLEKQQQQFAVDMANRPAVALSRGPVPKSASRRPASQRASLRQTFHQRDIEGLGGSSAQRMESRRDRREERDEVFVAAQPPEGQNGGATDAPMQTPGEFGEGPLFGQNANAGQQQQGQQQRKMTRPPHFHMYMNPQAKMQQRIAMQRIQQQTLCIDSRTLFDVAEEKGATSQSAVKAFEDGDNSIFLDTLYNLDDGVLDDENRQRKVDAIKLFQDAQKETQYKNERARIEFLKIRERFRLLELQRPVQHSLQRMEQRYKVSLQDWEERRQRLLESRRQQLTAVLTSFSNIILKTPREGEAPPRPPTAASMILATQAQPMGPPEPRMTRAQQITKLMQANARMNAMLSTRGPDLVLRPVSALRAVQAPVYMAPSKPPSPPVGGGSSRRQSAPKTRKESEGGGIELPPLSPPQRPISK